MYKVLPTDTVGVMGVGGLGHRAMQYASKMGCRVVVFSGTDSKKEEAMRLGASEFVAMKDVKELKTERPINALLVTTSAQPDWKLIMPVLAPCATIFPLSVAGGDFSIPYMDFLVNGLTVQASLVASRYIQNRMLEFSAQHKIAPIIEKFPLTEEGCNQAIEKLGAGNMRYRGVLLRQ
jgi:D-arabinose 1-dehydrogenase-like Zn-dependent alcohol dehydrogenase